MTDLDAETPGCVSVRKGIRCDRESGHKGSHRGPGPASEGVIFWPQLSEKKVLRQRGWLCACLERHPQTGHILHITLHHPDETTCLACGRTRRGVQ
jgi:hypothetical protein